MQDAAERALARWPRDGVPDNPAAWLTTTAHRRALDVLRRRRTETAKLQEVVAVATLEDGSGAAGDVLVGPGGAVVDDRLVLLFTCCHPALPLAGRVALTCRTVAGLSTRQIAAAFLVSEATMGQRLLRARQKIAHAGIGFVPPEPHRLAERTAGVLAVLYLLFNEGYVSSTGSADDPELARQALELTRLVTRLLPDDPEPSGLLALLSFQHSRRAARIDADGELVTMEDQDRTRWDRHLIDAGLQALAVARTRAGAGAEPDRAVPDRDGSDRAVPDRDGSDRAGSDRAGSDRAGPYLLQAEIAARHATAAEPAQTDWPGIVELYDRLLRRQPSPVVALNRAVAVAFAEGPEAGLTAVDAVAADPRLAGYHLVPAVRADLLRRAGRTAEAVAAYAEAEARARTDAERSLLQRRLRELEQRDLEEGAPNYHRSS